MRNPLQSQSSATSLSVIRPRGSRLIVGRPSGLQAGSGLSTFAAYWLFPGMVFSAVLGNQPFAVAMVLGQAGSIVSDVAAAIILFGAIRRKRWVLLLIALILIAKVARVVGGSSGAEVAYVALLNLLFCSAGAVVAFQRPTLVYMQAMVICLLNFVAMVFQVSGAGAWSQILTTHGEGNLTAPASTLFVRARELNYLLVQGRPAGISYANVILSLIVLYGFALHFGRKKEPLWWGTTLLCAVAVLSMAKIAFIGFVLVVLVVLMLGDREQKLRVRNASVVFVACLGLYALVFPGLMETNLDVVTLQSSFFYRVNDIMAAMNPDVSFREMNTPYFEGTAYLYMDEEGEFVSGYAALIATIYDYLVPVVSVLLVGIGVFVLGFRRLSREYPTLTLRITLVAVVVCLYPATHPIWTAPMYWFMAGLAYLPLLYWLRPRFLLLDRNDPAVFASDPPFVS